MEKSQSPVSAAERQKEASKALDDYCHGQVSKATMGLSPISLALAYSDWAMHLATSPGRQMMLAQKAVEQGQQVLQNALASAAQPAPAKADKDARFADPAWQQWPFNLFKEGFKATDAWWREATQAEGLTRHNRHLVEFFTRQSVDALSPSNWALTNPEVLKKAQETFGQSLVQGSKHLLEDWIEARQKRTEANPESLEPLPFAVGQDVAVTPGKVVYRNHLIELIQYLPSTDKVHPEPVLIVPSCIMKYYILDLSPSNSMVKYLVDQGHTVFIVSWRNPDASDRDLKMQDYLRMGVLDAMAAVKASTQAERLHTMGYCLGGTFLSIVAAALGRRNRLGEAAQKADGDRGKPSVFPEDLPQLASVILLAAQTDFSEPGELGVFIDDDQLRTLRQEMAEKGYFSGKQMGGSFQFLNSRDLVWSRSTRRYLLGEDDDQSFDLMSWNADQTRLPARMHSEYLTAMFLNNALASGQYRFGGQPVALMDIDAPMMVVGTSRDHVSPWRSVYKIHLQTDTQVTFVLASGGHNAGIVSEPGRPRRSYQIATREDGEGWVDPDAWVATTPSVAGSWWEAMHAWLAERSGKPVAPPAIAKQQVLCDAPGEYVMVRYAD